MYILEPEVSGQLGEKTVIDTSLHPPIVKYLHFVFYGWMGDDIIECFPIFLVTERLRKTLDDNNLSGYKIAACEIEKSDEFIKIQSTVDLPQFYWIQIVGNMSDDFSIQDKKLRISESALKVLKKHNLNYATIERS